MTIIAFQCSQFERRAPSISRPGAGGIVMISPASE
jgi:hypothetical protein